MPFSELFKGYPFPGAAAKFFLPPGPNDWQPKSWGATGYIVAPSAILSDDNAHFIDDGVLIGDVVYITAGDPPIKHADLVVDPPTQTNLHLSSFFVDGYTNVVYKVGMKAPHTLQSLINIVLARHLYAATIHWSVVWTQVPFKNFLHHQQGDVYVCHNPGKSTMALLLAQEHQDQHGNPIPNPWLILNPEPEP